MGYAETIAECCRYIDRNFQKELSAIELAEKYHYSYYHFCRIFQVIKDISVAEYIRCKRMEAAIDRIYGGAGMLEAALDVGFETPAGFSKAFKKKYGCTPTEYFRSYKDGEGHFMTEPKIVELQPFFVLGHERGSEVKKQGEDTAAYWYQEKEDRVGHGHGHGHGHHHGHMQKDDVKIGLWLKETDEDGNLKYFFGSKTAEKPELAEGMQVVEIPAGKYAVFTTEPLNMTLTSQHQAFALRIRDTWKYIYRVWFSRSRYVPDEKGYDFEYYDIRCTDKEACCMDIYIAVKEV